MSLLVLLQLYALPLLFILIRQFLVVIRQHRVHLFEGEVGPLLL